MTDDIDAHHFVALTKALAEAIAVARPRRPPDHAAVARVEASARGLTDTLAALNYADIATVIGALAVAQMNNPRAAPTFRRIDFQEDRVALWSAVRNFVDGEPAQFYKTWPVLLTEAREFFERYGGRGTLAP